MALVSLCLASGCDRYKKLLKNKKLNDTANDTKLMMTVWRDRHFYFF